MNLARLARFAAAFALVAGAASAQTYTPGTYYRGNDANGPPSTPTSLNVIPSVCSGTIATGGTPQTQIPYVNARRGFRIQNQSTGPIYIRSTGPNGTLTATQDQASFRIDAGVTYEPSTISDFAYSLVGATTGQAFHCQYW